ncbi:MAG TPA: 50S ribosomal protein L22 [Thermomicrobiales bacterium]|nr:50S ribosomal protein L22 [Thermomicrobiales bacterium]
MEVRASAERVRISPRKARLVVDMVRGKKVNDAIEIMRFVPNRAAEDVERLLKSVRANAENNYDLDPDTLWIKAIYADDAPQLRRFKPKARGRVGKILRRSCHITVIAEDRERR